MVYPQRLGDDIKHPHVGVQGRKGVLEDHLDVGPHGGHLALGQLGQILALEQHLAVGGIQQTDDGVAQGGLAAARLAHHAQGLPLFQREAHIVHGPQHAFLFA